LKYITREHQKVTTNQPTSKKSSNTILIALMAIWSALLLAASFIPAYPIFGTGATITFSSILLNGLTAPLLGPIFGTASGLIFGFLAPYVNPMTNSFGLLTFLSPMMAALMAGLLLFNRWKEGLSILVLQIIIWLAQPNGFAFYQLMPLIMWQYIPIFIFFLVPPVRKKIINSIVTLDAKYLAIALWCVAWTARIGGDVMTGNNLSVYVFNFGIPELYPYWAPLTLYYAVADTLNCVIGALIGAGVLIALQRSGLRITALDRLRAKLTPKPVS
jgi:hypothetical protein